MSDFLAPTRDASLAVAAVFGEHAGWLLDHAPDWLDSHKAVLMRSDAFGEVFLTTALAGHIPHLRLITRLEPGLAALLQRTDAETGEESERPRRRQSAAELIGSRLTALFLGGHLDLTHPLLTLYNSAAPPADRATVLGEIGWQFARSDSVAEDVCERAMRLWDSRLDNARDGDSSYQELAAFESWVRCGHLPAEWWLPRLTEIAEHTTPGGFRHVGDAIAREAEDHLAESLHILDMLIRAFAQTRVISHTLRRAAPKVIELALQSPDLALRTKGDDLFDFLGRHGGPYFDPTLSELAERRSSYLRRSLRAEEDPTQHSHEREGEGP